MRTALATRIRAIADRRPPNVVIGGDSNPYLRRWFVIPRNRFFNIYLHQFVRSDDDRALHDHPWLFNVSWLLEGDYAEHSRHGVTRLKCGSVKVRFGSSPHRVQLVWELQERKECPVWTLFITGPKFREWGFLCPNGWRHWKQFTSNNGTTVGLGCE